LHSATVNHSMCIIVMCIIVMYIFFMHIEQLMVAECKLQDMTLVFHQPVAMKSVVRTQTVMLNHVEPRPQWLEVATLV
jgi:uncharacterized lipoprotein YajG